MSKVRSFIEWVRRLFTVAPPAERTARSTPAPVRAQQSTSVAAQKQAEAYVARVRAKISRLAEDFNAGTINRAQFRNLYGHYQKEIRGIEDLIVGAPSSEEWKAAVREGESVVIRRRHLARAQGYAIYRTDSGMPLSTLGRFDLDPALLVPMLSAYRTATREIFGAGMSSSEIEGGRWLCFVPGEFTTMLSIFTSEPATKQLKLLEELHRLFERANRRELESGQADPNVLVFPHEYFLGHWKR